MRRAFATCTRLLLAGLACLVLAWALLPASSGGPTRIPAPPRPLPPVSAYGVSADFLGDAGTPTAVLFADQVLGPRGRIRLFVPWDALADASGGVCAASPAAVEGAAAWRTLTSELARARSRGLVPQLVFGEGTGTGGMPADPDPAAPAQAADYACGVRTILQNLWQSHAATGVPVDIEAWNEPENDGYAANWNGACADPDRAPSCSGPWEAAMLWYLAAAQARELARTIPGFPALRVAALTMAAPDENDFLDAGSLALRRPDGRPYSGYYQSLWEIVHCTAGFGGCTDPLDDPAAMPVDWAIHDYVDPTAGGTADLRQFVATLAALNDRLDAGAGADVWITESGVELDSPVAVDLNDPGGISCAAAAGVAADTLGCLVDGNPAAQAQGARAWLALRGVSAPTAVGRVTVTQLFWYQFALSQEECTAASPCALGDGQLDTSAPLPSLHAWDSALVDSNGTPRASYCVLVGQPATDCVGRADAYADAQWVDWWNEGAMPHPCPAHDGAWVAESPNSGVPGGEECYYSPKVPPGD